MSYIAYFDLLGVSSLATLDPDSYYDSLENFREVISQNCSILDGHGQIFFFSDCAFVSSDNLLLILRFIRKIRIELFLQGSYFRGSIGVGNLEPSNVIAEKRYSASVVETRKNVLRGFSFGKNVIPVYYNENNLKGIGIWVDVDDKKILKNECVISCHIPQLNNRRASCYTDLKFNVSEITEHAIEILFRNLYKANIQNSKLGRYYVPLIITWIQSLHLSTLKFEEKWTHGNTPEIINLLFSGKMQSMFHDVVGIEYIYFAALNKIYEECKSEPDVIGAANEFFFRKKNLLKYYSAIPDHLFFPDNKKEYLVKLSMARIKI